MKADTILGGAAALVAQGFPDTADNLLQHHRDLTDDCAPLAALRARLSVYNAQASGAAGYRVAPLLWWHRSQINMNVAKLRRPTPARLQAPACPLYPI